MKRIIALTVKEAAKYLSCSERTIYKQVSLGKLKCYRPTSSILFKKSELNDYVNNNPVNVNSINIGYSQNIDYKQTSHNHLKFKTSKR